MEEDYKFLPRDKITDDRALFANQICDLLSKVSEFSLSGSLEIIAPINITPLIALAPDMRGVCNMAGTFEIKDSPRKTTRMKK